MCCDRGDVTSDRKRQDGVKCAAILERATVLKVFALEHDSPIRPFIEGGRDHHGCPSQSRTDAVCGRRDVCKSGNGAGVRRLH
jgi:hypothetical protein